MNKLTILGILIWFGLAMILKFAQYILKKKLDCYEGFCGINHGQKMKYGSNYLRVFKEKNDGKKV